MKNLSGGEPPINLYYYKISISHYDTEGALLSSTSYMSDNYFVAGVGVSGYMLDMYSPGLTIAYDGSKIYVSIQQNNYTFSDSDIVHDATKLYDYNPVTREVVSYSTSRSRFWGWQGMPGETMTFGNILRTTGGYEFCGGVTYSKVHQVYFYGTFQHMGWAASQSLLIDEYGGHRILHGDYETGYWEYHYKQCLYEGPINCYAEDTGMPMLFIPAIVSFYDYVEEKWRFYDVIGTDAYGPMSASRDGKYIDPSVDQLCYEGISPDLESFYIPRIINVHYQCTGKVAKFYIIDQDGIKLDYEETYDSSTLAPHVRLLRFPFWSTPGLSSGYGGGDGQTSNEEYFSIAYYIPPAVCTQTTLWGAITVSDEDYIPYLVTPWEYYPDASIQHSIGAYRQLADSTKEEYNNVSFYTQTYESLPDEEPTFTAKKKTWLDDVLVDCTDIEENERRWVTNGKTLKVTKIQTKEVPA